MRKSIDVESVTAFLVNVYRAKLWKNKVEELVKSVVVASTEYKNGYQQKLKEELEFAKANIELLSEDDYKWLLEQEKSPSAESKKSKESLAIDSPEFKEALANAPFVCKVHDNSGTEVMDKFKKVATKCTAARDTVKETISKPKVGNKEASESRSTRWLVQITKGKDVYYRTLRTANRMSPSILDAKCYVSENAAKQAANSVAIENRLLTLSTVNNGNIAESCVVEVKEVLCTESSSRTIELVKPVVEAVEKPITKAQVRARKPKVKEEWVLYTHDFKGKPWYYHGEISIPTHQSSMLLEEAKKFPSYGAATKAKCKLIKAGFATLEVAELGEFCK